MKKTITALLIASIAAFMVAGCGDPAERAAERPQTADLVYPNWAEGIAYTHLAKVILEDQMDYECNITSADVGPGYTAVAQGSHDAFMECWPNLHEQYLERFEGRLASLGNIYEGTQTGLAVPSYVTIDKISELDAHADKFGGRITGIDSGAGVMIQTEEDLIPTYEIENLSLLASSGPAMTAALKDAVDNEEWIVVTSWRPHWMFGRWDLKFLEQDEDKIIWETGDIEIIGRVGLDEEKPELAQFLRNMYLSDEDLSDLMLTIEESSESTLAVARDWMNANPQVWQDWIPESN